MHYSIRDYSRGIRERFKVVLYFSDEAHFKGHNWRSGEVQLKYLLPEDYRIIEELGELCPLDITG